MYKTISRTSESLHKVKGSKHFGFAFPVRSVDEVEQALAELRKRHHAARHHCYAWVLGADMGQQRINDAGEPANSAGPPILGQIRAFDLTNILVVVVRYFGGTKLGVGGLIQAYKTAAQMAIEANAIVTVHLRHLYKIVCSYGQISDVLLIARTAGMEITNQQFDLNCTVTVALPEEDEVKIQEAFAALPDVKPVYAGIEEYEL